MVATDEPDGGEPLASRVGAWVLVLGALALAVLSLAPPEVGDAPLESGYDPVRGRALQARLAVEPHPVGSPAHAAVRALLLEELAAAGLELELQRGLVRGRELTNVLARLPATGPGPSTGTLLLAAHYDTVPGSPGAGDDSAGCVALLEAARVLAELPRRNDVLLLFSDGEELGLLGARLFAAGRPLPGTGPAAADGDPPRLPGSRRSPVPLELAVLPSTWTRTGLLDLPGPFVGGRGAGLHFGPLLLRADGGLGPAPMEQLPPATDRLAGLACLLNFEAIGNGGPALMFETGPGSGRLVELWAAASRHPIGNSLAAVVYGWMPNDTDLSVFRDRGLPGLNFAIAGGSGHYHSPADVPGAFDPDALAHLGDLAVGLARRLVQEDLGALGGPSERAFVGLPPFGTLTWTHRGHLVVGLLALALSLALGRRQLAPRRLLAGAAAALELAASAGAGAVLVSLLGLVLVRPGLPLTYGEVELLLATLVVGAGLGAAGFARRRPRDAASLATGALGTWGLLLLVFAAADLASLGASYPFALALPLLALACWLRLQRGAPVWLAGLVLAPAVFVLAPILAHLVQLGSRSLTTAIGLGGALLGLGALLLAPLFSELRPKV